MDKNRIVTFSLLAHINDHGLLTSDILEVFIPLVKRTLSTMCLLGITKGKNISEIKGRVDEVYGLDIPIPVLRTILQKLSQEVNSEERVVLRIYESDDSFEMKEFSFGDYDELISKKESEVKRLEAAYSEFIKLNSAEGEQSSSIFYFIEQNKISIGNYLGHKNQLPTQSDFLLEAQFVNYFRSIPDLFEIVKSIYIGSIIASYLEYKTNPIEGAPELVFDTNFLVSIIDLNTPESTHTCRKLVEVCKQMGCRLSVLDITIEETRKLLFTKAEYMDRTFLAKKVDEEDIYNACDRRKLNRTDLEQIGDSLESLLNSLGILVVPNTEKFKNEARHSKEYNDLRKVRNTTFAALHDATALMYVRSRRSRRIRDFERVNCWFVNNSSFIRSQFSHGYDASEFQPESIKAEDLLNILWLSSPGVKQQVSSDDISRIGLSRLVSTSITESLPSSSIIRDLDANIQKYAKDKLEAITVHRVASRIARRGLRNIEDLNALARKDSEAFIKRLEQEAIKEKEDEDKQVAFIKEAVEKLTLSESEHRTAAKSFEDRNERIAEREMALAERERQIKDLERNNENRRKSIENDWRKPLRASFVANKMFKWRLRSFLYMMIGPVVLALAGTYFLWFNNWDLAVTESLWENHRNNIVLSSVVAFAAMLYSGIFIKLFADKFNRSEISAFKSTLDIPTALQEIS